MMKALLFEPFGKNIPLKLYCVDCWGVYKDTGYVQGYATSYTTIEDALWKLRDIEKQYGMTKPIDDPCEHIQEYCIAHDITRDTVLDPLLVVYIDGKLAEIIQQRRVPIERACVLARGYIVPIYLAQYNRDARAKYHWDTVIKTCQNEEDV